MGSHGADKAAEVLQEAEDTFMAADSKYNTARETQDLDELDLNEPLNVSLNEPQTSVCMILCIV